MSAGCIELGGHEKSSKQFSLWKEEKKKMEEKRKLREEADIKQTEQIQNLQRQTERLAVELEIQKHGAEEGRLIATEKHHEQMRVLQTEKDRLATELAKRELEVQNKRAEMEKQAEAARYQEQMRVLQIENERMAAELATRELEQHKKRAEEERQAEINRFQEQMKALQIEKDNMAAELERRKEEERSSRVSRENQRQQNSYSPSDYESLKKTVYGHTHCEPRETQMGVAFVIVNRAKANQDYWGYTSINEVCRKPGQFWFGIFGEPQIHDWNTYNSIDEWLPGVIRGEVHDLTNGANHFLPKWETHHDWLSNVTQVASYGNFNFFKAKWLP